MNEETNELQQLRDRVAELEGMIEEASTRASTTNRSPGSTFISIMSALGFDYGYPLHVDHSYRTFYAFDDVDVAKVEMLKNKLRNGVFEAAFEGAREAAEVLDHLSGQLAALRQEYSNLQGDLDFSHAATAEVRRVCKVIMGDNLAFIDDDVARALQTVKERAESAEMALKRRPEYSTLDISYSPDDRAPRASAGRHLASVHIAERPDGGIRVYSPDAPGLILSGQDDSVMMSLLPALRSLVGRTERHLAKRQAHVDQTSSDHASHAPKP